MTAKAGVTVLVCVYSRYRRKARRRLKRSTSAAATVTDGDEGKENGKLQTESRSRRRGDSDRTGARSATTPPSRPRRAAVYRGDAGTRRTSWQRVRPLPIPQLPELLPPPVDDSPAGPVSPPDAEMPLLSPLSLRLLSAPHRDNPPPPGHTATHRQPPDGARSAEVGGQRRLTTSGGSSPYYFKLDPALTARQNDRHQRFYSHNACFMCESEIR